MDSSTSILCRPKNLHQRTLVRTKKKQKTTQMPRQPTIAYNHTTNTELSITTTESINEQNNKTTNAITQNKTNIKINYDIDTPSNDTIVSGDSVCIEENHRKEQH